METGKDREFNTKSEYAVDLFYSVVAWYKKHKTSCAGSDCIWCGMWDCPHTEPTHHWPDGCAACDKLISAPAEEFDCPCQRCNKDVRQDKPMD